MLFHHFLQEVPDQQLIFSLQPVSVLRIEFQICQFTDSLCLFPPQIAITDFMKNVFLRQFFSAEVIIRALDQNRLFNLLSGSLGYVIAENIQPFSHKCTGKQHLYQNFLTEFIAVYFKRSGCFPDITQLFRRSLYIMRQILQNISVVFSSAKNRQCRRI